MPDSTVLQSFIVVFWFEGANVADVEMSLNSKGVLSSQCSSEVNNLATADLCSLLATSCSGTKLALLIDMSVLASATIDSRWFVVSVVLSSQCSLEVNNLERQKIM